jgi:uncharacterized protein YbaR (Trm112 family)
MIQRITASVFFAPGGVADEVLIELVDVLRCPHAHQETYLVASVDRTEGRQIMEGVLGCPICLAEFPIRGGVAEFSEGAAPRVSSFATRDDDALRLAALLDLTSASGFAVLFGSWGRAANQVAALTPVPLVLVNPPGDVTVAERISIVRCANVLPLASGSARAGALDPSLDIPVTAQAAAVRTRGRVVGPTSIAPLTGMREIARDERTWVAESDATTSAPITLTARPR